MQDNKLTRIETKLTKLMLHLDCDPYLVNGSRVKLQQALDSTWELRIFDKNTTLHELEFAMQSYVPLSDSDEVPIVYEDKVMGWWSK